MCLFFFLFVCLFFVVVVCCFFFCFFFVCFFFVFFFLFCFFFCFFPHEVFCLDMTMFKSLRRVPFSDKNQK